nr:tankyrase-1-like [Loxodonta africana]
MAASRRSQHHHHHHQQQLQPAPGASAPPPPPPPPLSPGLAPGATPASPTASGLAPFASLRHGLALTEGDGSRDPPDRPLISGPSLTVLAVAVPPAQSVPSLPLAVVPVDFCFICRRRSLAMHPVVEVQLNRRPLLPRLPHHPLHPPLDRAWRRAPRLPALAPQRHWGLGRRDLGRGSPQ